MEDPDAIGVAALGTARALELVGRCTVNAGGLRRLDVETAHPSAKTRLGHPRSERVAEIAEEVVEYDPLLENLRIVRQLASPRPGRSPDVTPHEYDGQERCDGNDTQQGEATPPAGGPLDRLSLDDPAQDGAAHSETRKNEEQRDGLMRRAVQRVARKELHSDHARENPTRPARPADENETQPRALAARVLRGCRKGRQHRSDEEQADGERILGRRRGHDLVHARNVGVEARVVDPSPSHARPSRCRLSVCELDFLRHSFWPRAEVLSVLRPLLRQGPPARVRIPKPWFRRCWDPYEALRALVELGPDAVPAIVRRLDDRRRLPRPFILVENAPGFFEAYAHYGPETVMDALTIVRLTGVSLCDNLTTANEDRPADDVRARCATRWAAFTMLAIDEAESGP